MTMHCYSQGLQRGVHTDTVCHRLTFGQVSKGPDIRVRTSLCERVVNIRAQTIPASDAAPPKSTLKLHCYYWHQRNLLPESLSKRNNVPCNLWFHDLESASELLWWVNTCVLWATTNKPFCVISHKKGKVLARTSLCGRRWVNIHAQTLGTVPAMWQLLTPPWTLGCYWCQWTLELQHCYWKRMRFPAIFTASTLLIGFKSELLWWVNMGVSCNMV